MIGECSGKMRSTPWPNDTLRTVKVARAPPRCMPITMPSNTWMRSLSPSRTFTCTRTVSPGLIAGRLTMLAALDGLNGSHDSLSFASHRSRRPTCPRFAITHPAARVFGSRARRAGEQIRPALERALERLAPPPLLDLRVVPRQQHRRHRHAPELRRPRVLRKVEQPARERIARHRCLVADDARDQPRHRVDDHQRRQLAARQHVVADRDRLGRQVRRAPARRPLRSGRTAPPGDRSALSRVADRVREPLAVGRRQDHRLAGRAPPLAARDRDRPPRTAARASAPSPARRQTACRRRRGAGRS